MALGQLTIDMHDISTILKYVDHAYGSLASPKYNFVKDAYLKKNDQFRQLLTQNDFTVSETTDLNCDVSLTYYVTKGPLAWTIQTSLVGPYAFIMGVDSKNCIEFRKDPATTTLGKLIAHSGLTLLTTGELEKKVEFGEMEKSLYAILFSDVESEPWLLN